MSYNKLVKDLCIFSKRKDILEKERELSQIITEKLCIFQCSAHFDNNKDKMKRFWELRESKKEKRNEIDRLENSLEEELKYANRK